MQLKLLPNIKSPADIREFSPKELQQLADEIRFHTIDVVSEIGGHLASTLGVVELTVALHKVFNTPTDKIIWDVGHQAYAHKLLTGRFDAFPTIRQYGGLSGFLKRSESEYDVFGAGHASTSISAGVGIAESQKHTGKKFKVVSIIGDGAMTGGLAFEALNNGGHLRTPMLVVLNDNKMSISPNVGAINTYLTKIVTNPIYNRIRDEIWNISGKLPFGKRTARSMLHRIEESLKSLLVPGMLFEELGFRYFGPIDGYNIDELVPTLERIKNLKTPALLHILTKKGKGMEVAENDPIKYHGVKPNGSSNGKVSTTKNVPIFQDVFGLLVCEIARNRKDMVCITAAMREGTGLAPFAKEFPKRFYDVGIAEGHAVTFAAGLATEGVRPIVAIYSTFLQRAYDHIIHDVAIQHLPVVFCLDRSGIAGEDGPTHHGTLDIAYLKCIQDLVLASPKDGNELRHLLYTALDYQGGPFAIRYPKSSSLRFDPHGQAELLPEAYLGSIIGRFNQVITLEEGIITGGFGEGVSAWLAVKGYKGEVQNIGLPNKFVEHGPRDLLLKKLGVCEAGIIEAVHAVKNPFEIKE